MPSTRSEAAVFRCVRCCIQWRRTGSSAGTGTRPVIRQVRRRDHRPGRRSACVGFRNDHSAFANKRGLNCQVARCFKYLRDKVQIYDAIILEQELNHLTIDEMIAVLRLCHRALKPGGTVFAYGLNGANPMVGAENLAHNIDHFNSFAEHSLRQVLGLAGFVEIRLLPLKLYVFWSNPLNYVGLFVTGMLELWYKLWFKLYGKNVKILSKKIAATAKRSQ